MAVVKRLGTGYYEIELSNTLLNPEIAAIVSRAFGNFTSIPKSNQDLEQGLSPKRPTTSNALGSVTLGAPDW